MAKVFKVGFLVNAGRCFVILLDEISRLMDQYTFKVPLNNVVFEGDDTILDTFEPKTLPSCFGYVDQLGSAGLRNAGE